MTLPPNVGFPVGGSGGVQYGILQFHYDNPSQSNSFVDSSGVRLHIRPRSGEDAGFMFVGVDSGYIRIPQGNIVRFVCLFVLISILIYFIFIIIFNRREQMAYNG